MVVAIQMTEYGPPEVLHPVDRPIAEPGEGDVVVRTVVAGVNRADLFIRAGAWPQSGGWPYVPGLEVAGTVAHVGAGVTDWAPGDRVITMMQRLGGIHGSRAGGYQEEVTVPAGCLAAVPDGLDLLTAGELGLPAVTALEAIHALETQEGATVLVHAGSSAVGTMAIQVLAARGARVIATGTRPEKFELMEACGAHRVVCTRDPDWPGSVGAVDRVLDLVGTATFGPTVDLITPGGRLVFAGGTSGGELSFSGWQLMLPVTLTGYSSETLTGRRLRAVIQEIATLAAAGSLRPVRVTRFPLDEAWRAHAELESGRLAGRVVLRPGAE